MGCNGQELKLEDVSPTNTFEAINKLEQYRKHLSIAHLKTQSIASTFPQFEVMLNSRNFDVITLSETWLKDNKDLLNHVQISGYNFG